MSAVIGVRAAWCVASVGRTPPNPAYANDINEQNDRDFELAEGESSEAKHQPRVRGRGARRDDHSSVAR